MKEERIAVPDPEPIKGGPTVLPPKEEKVKIAKEPEIVGGAAGIYRPPVKEERKLISEPEIVKKEKIAIAEPEISKEKERIVGGPGTYPEPKKEKIAIAEPEIVGGAGSIYRPPEKEVREKAVKSVDPVPLKKEPLVLEAPVALDGAPAPVAAPVEAPLTATAAPPAQPAKSNPASDCQKLKDAAK